MATDLDDILGAHEKKEIRCVPIKNIVTTIMIFRNMSLSCLLKTHDILP